MHVGCQSTWALKINELCLWYSSIDVADCMVHKRFPGYVENLSNVPGVQTLIFNYAYLPAMYIHVLTGGMVVIVHGRLLLYCNSIVSKYMYLETIDIPELYSL